VGTTPGVTILWALRSPCQLACQYCYFGTLDDRPAGPRRPRQIGDLTHVGADDASLGVVLKFISTFHPGLVRRVFLAGGEPLVWSGVREVITALKAAAVEIIVCTNGQPLQDDELASRLLMTPVAAVSVSLDSHDAVYNDRWRVDHSGRGWAATVQGLKMLVARRRALSATTRIGVYAVITRQNITHIVDTAKFVADLGVDYFIVQPVSLSRDHKLHSVLSIQRSDLASLADAINILQGQELQIHLPNERYLQLVLQSLTSDRHPRVERCFGGRELFFVQPDGSVWDCPSRYKIAATPRDELVSIVRQSAREIFSVKRRERDTSCDLFSDDCVNMWQLMAFDEILYPMEAESGR
jgi:MoaA/NifB/PqqE/SkfB family radical SAM enzyme